LIHFYLKKRIYTSPFSSIATHDPKSVSLICPSRSIKTLSGFTSLFFVKKKENYFLEEEKEKRKKKVILEEKEKKKKKEKEKL